MSVVVVVVFALLACDICSFVHVQWEVVMISRKTVTTAIAVVFTGLHQTQGLYGLLSVFFFGSLHVRFFPYDHPSLNYLETWTLAVTSQINSVKSSYFIGW